MNRQEFMNQLAAELTKLPREEVQAAMEYYSEYFDEAGPENEAQAIEEIGSPSKIATQIKADYAVKQLDRNHGARGSGGISAVMWIVLGIFAAPIAMPLAFALGTVAFALFITIIACAFALAVSFGALCASGIFMIIMGLVGLASSFTSGMLMIGIGLITTSVMALLCYGVIIGARALIRVIARNFRNFTEARRIKKFTREGK